MSFYDDLSVYKSSCRAQRFACKQCNDWIGMIYNHSVNIWLVCDRLEMDCNDIEFYCIYQASDVRQIIELHG